MIRVVHTGSRIRTLTFYPSRIPDPDPQHCTPSRKCVPVHDAAMSRNDVPEVLDLKSALEA
jgi:hypothetical protein